LLRNRKLKNFKFRRQHVVEGFVIDFYCHELKLGIEVDGGIHNKRKDYDKLRQEIIESEGIVIIRISNKEIVEDKTAVIRKLEEALRYASPQPTWDIRKNVDIHLPCLPAGRYQKEKGLQVPLPLGEGGRLKIAVS